MWTPSAIFGGGLNYCCEEMIIVAGATFTFFFFLFFGLRASSMCFGHFVGTYAWCN
jgi:hypothetical protein